MSVSYNKVYDKDEIRESLLDIVTTRTKVGRTAIKDKNDLVDDLGMDSLDTIMVIMDAEDEFEVLIDDPSSEKVQTFGELVNTVIDKLDMSNRLKK